MALWIPPAAREQRFVCRVPGPEGPCGAVFATEAGLVRHLRSCTAAHEGEIRTGSIRHRVPALDAWDPEVEQHMRHVGRRMVAEGRMRVKPSERAGFS